MCHLYDLSSIDWYKCHEYSCKSSIKIVCDLWDQYRSSLIISDIVKLSRYTVSRYLKHGAELGWCNYSSKNENKNSNTYKNKIICLKNNKVFNSIEEISLLYKLNHEYILNICNKKIYDPNFEFVLYKDYIKTLKTTNNFEKEVK